MKLNTFICFIALLFLNINLGKAQLKPLFYNVEYSDGNQKLEGFFSKPKKINAKKSGILILPAWMGIDKHSKDIANKLSNLGYYTFVADIYGKDNRPKNTNEAGQKAGYFKSNYKEYQKRIQLALEQLIKKGANPNEIVVIGYCFGGDGAIEAAKANFNIKGAVSFHGSLSKTDSPFPNSIKAKILILHGADDPFVKEGDIKDLQNSLRKAKADWQMVYYGNAVHSFTDLDADNSIPGALYDEKANTRSWKALLSFLDETLK